MKKKFTWTFIVGALLATAVFAATLQIAPRNAAGDACEMPLYEESEEPCGT